MYTISELIVSFLRESDHRHFTFFNVFADKMIWYNTKHCITNHVNIISITTGFKLSSNFAHLLWIGHDLKYTLIISSVVEIKSMTNLASLETQNRRLKSWTQFIRYYFFHKYLVFVRLYERKFYIFFSSLSGNAIWRTWMKTQKLQPF